MTFFRVSDYHTDSVDGIDSAHRRILSDVQNDLVDVAVHGWWTGLFAEMHSSVSSLYPSFSSEPIIISSDSPSFVG